VGGDVARFLTALRAEGGGGGLKGRKKKEGFAKAVEGIGYFGGEPYGKRWIWQIQESFRER